MAEEKQQSPGAEQQPNDNTLNEPSIGLMYDKEKDQAKVFSQNPDGSIGMVDPTPENESLFFVMDKNIPLNFYKNLQKYHNNPTINIYVLPRRALGRMKDALKRYWNRTTSDDVKLYYNYKMNPDGQFECKMKTRGIPINEMPWNTLNRMGYSFGGLEKSNYLQKLQNYDQTGMHKLKYHDDIINYIGEGKIRLKKSGNGYKVDVKSYARILDEGLFNQKFTDTDMRNLEMYGNLGRVLETSEGPLLVSRDFDTRQLDYMNAESAFIPRYVRGTELTQEDINSFRHGEVREIAIVNRDGSVNIVPYQYNAVFRKPMEVLTLEQRNAIANKQREQRDLERIISTPSTGEQTPKQSAKQTAEAAKQGQAPTPTPASAPEQSQQGQAAKAVGQGQTPTPAPAAVPEQPKQEQAAEAAKQGQAPTPAAAPEQSQQGQTAEAVGQGQTPTPAAGQKQGQQGQTPTQGQTPQGQRQPGSGQKPPRPQVAMPTPRNGRKRGKHI